MFLYGASGHGKVVLEIAPDIIKQISFFSEHDFGTHTFSHFYCLEDGQNILQFKSDLEAAILAAKKFGINTYSLIFPRNQCNVNYLSVCKDLGITCYRGVEKSFMYTPKSSNFQEYIKKILRFLDSYFNISGYNSYSFGSISHDFPMNLPSSRFLRSFTLFDYLFIYFKKRRIINEMTYAAKNNLVFHLWWHPENFGKYKKYNFRLLSDILTHYIYLNGKYHFTSHNMSSFAKLLHET